MTTPGDATGGGRARRRREWLPRERPSPAESAAARRLTDGLRRTIEVALDVDASEAELLAAAGAIEQVAERLAAARGQRALRGFAETSTAGDTGALFDSSPVSGGSNAIAPPLRFWVEDGAVRGSGSFGWAYEGPPGHVHGGMIAAAFDELLGLAQSMSDRSGMTGTLTVRYRSPTPLHRELTFAARLDRVEGRKIYTSGTLHAGDVLCAEAEGIFVSVDFSRLEGLARAGD